MDYFVIMPDKRILNLPKMQAFTDEQKQEHYLGGEKIQHKKAVQKFYVEESTIPYTYGDYLSEPFPMINERLHTIMQKYQRDVVFERVDLVEKGTGLQWHYYQIAVSEIDCASQSQSKFSRSGEVLELVLDIKQVRDASIFMVKGYHGQVLVRLDVAESILRRNPNGVWFEPVKMSGR